MATYNLVQCVFDREGLAPDEDVAIITFHIREVIQGAPDIVPITDQGRADCVSALNDWWAQLQGIMVDDIMFREARFYDVPPERGLDMGDPVLVHTFGGRGTLTSNAMPPQCAISVTYKTDKRATWGRHYLPGIGVSQLDSSARLTFGAAQLIAEASHHLTDRSGTGSCLTVFSRKEWTHHDPQTIQVDDIVDIIRSRRYSSPLFRHTLSAG